MIHTANGIPDHDRIKMNFPLLTSHFVVVVVKSSLLENMPSIPLFTIEPLKACVLASPNDAMVATIVSPHTFY